MQKASPQARESRGETYQSTAFSSVTLSEEELVKELVKGKYSV